MWRTVSESPSHTETHTRTKKEKKNTYTPQAHTHSAKHRYEVICMMIKLHTVHHMKDSITQGIENTRRRRSISKNTFWEAASTSRRKQLRKSREKFSSWSVVVVSCSSRQGETFLLSLQVVGRHWCVCVCRDGRWEGFTKHYQAACWKWTCLSAEADCYYVKRSSLKSWETDLLQIWVPNVRVETGNEAGASRISQASLSDADKSIGPWIMINSC